MGEHELSAEVQDTLRALLRRDAELTRMLEEQSSALLAIAGDVKVVKRVTGLLPAGSLAPQARTYQLRTLVTVCASVAAGVAFDKFVSLLATLFAHSMNWGGEPMPFQKKQATAIAVRRAPSVPKAKYELAIAAKNAASRRAREAAEERVGIVIGTVAAYGVGMLEKKGTRVPTVAGVEPTLLYGALASFGPSLLGIKGRAANIISEAGAASLGIAAYKFGLGHPMVGEDE